MTSSTRKEILYEGYYYDVTDFIKRHPGGEEILQYHTQPGEDATLPFQQFHNRNFKKVIGILKSFKKRPASEVSLVQANDAKSLRSKAMTEDYLKLFRELQEEGLFEPSYPHIAYRLVEPILFTLVGALVLTLWDHPYRILVGSATLAVGQIRCGWAMHEGGHHSLTGIPQVDRFLQSALLGISQGISAQWWRLDHNQHHAMTNRLHHDVDIDFNPLIAINKIFVKDGTQPNFIMRHQKYFLPIDAIIAFFYWKLWHTPLTLMKHPNMTDMAFIGLHYLLCFQFISFQVYMTSATIAAWYLFSNVSLSHTFLPLRDESGHWVEIALRHSTDVEHRLWCDWWMGYLNYQIEHHLFPTMPQRNNKRAVERVKALAAKYQLPYHVYPYWKVAWMSIKNIADVEEDLRKMPILKRG